MDLHHAGFTLVELLVVVSVIGILVAILLPAIKLVRQQAGGAACGNVMRQCAAAHMAYSVDNRGYVPFTNNNGPKDGSWPYLIKQYTERSKTDSTGTGGSSRRPASTCCASFPKEYRTSTSPQFDGTNGGLARNATLVPGITDSFDSLSLTTAWPVVRFVQVTLQDRRILLGHTDLGEHITASASATTPFSPSNYNIWPAGTPTGTPGGNGRPSFQRMLNIHGQGMPYAFVDGHVQQVSVLTEAAKGFYNPTIFKP